MTTAAETARTADIADAPDITGLTDLKGPLPPPTATGHAGHAPHVVHVDPLQRIARLRDGVARVKAELGKVIVGQDAVIEQLLIGLACRGHCLLVGVPGLAKTLMISALAKTLNLAFSRIQFTPDLMPGDITGTEVLFEDREAGIRDLRFVKGPVFANVVLADEINRTPPKTQSALLEAMQERQVTAGGIRHGLPDPFFVLATQNPIAQEGTYPLPEAQLDRFLFQIRVDYPEEEEELDIVRRTTARQHERPEPVLSAADILELQDLVRQVPVAEHVLRHATTLARMTRRGRPGVPDFVNEYVAWGAGPRASQHLVLAAKARALLSGRPSATRADVEAVAAPVLRHRVLVNYKADADGVTPEGIIGKLLSALPRPAGDSRAAAHLEGVMGG